MKQILTGHTSPATAYKVEDYPYGYTLRTSIFYWIESKKGKGDRFVSQTINPKTGRLNAPKASTYSPLVYMFLNEDGHVKWGCIQAFDWKEFAQRFTAIAPAIVPSLNEIQIDNLRTNYAGTLHASAVWALVKYSPAARPAFKRWLSDAIVHVMNCTISELVNHPAAPAPDQPDEEVKFITTETFVIA